MIKRLQIGKPVLLSEKEKRRGELLVNDLASWGYITIW